ncbi:hypothetical protein C8J57DRAFT_710867 [Mycena rebaudengoi]|nr:hypothetical protein C8J57DRAFT_710867 [Mycena rebaudengoi]
MDSLITVPYNTGKWCRSPVFSASAFSTPDPNHTCTSLCFALHHRGMILARGLEPYRSNMTLFGLQELRIVSQQSIYPEDSLDMSTLSQYLDRELGIPTDQSAPPPPDVFSPRRHIKPLPTRRAFAHEDTRPAPPSPHPPTKASSNLGVFARAISDVRGQASKSVSSLAFMLECWSHATILRHPDEYKPRNQSLTEDFPDNHPDEYEPRDQSLTEDFPDNHPDEYDPRDQSLTEDFPDNHPDIW